MKTSLLPRAYDTPIRNALTHWLRLNPSLHTKLYRQEFAVGHGFGFADLAVCQHDSLDGYEIKSAHDSLARLEHQIHYYGLVFDTSTLIVDERHLKRAQDIIPPHWGLMVSQGTEIPVLEEIRIARANPHKTIGWIEYLLWKPEALKLLDRLSPDHKLKWKNRGKVHAALIQSASAYVLNKLVIDEIRKRSQYWQTLDVLQ